MRMMYDIVGVQMPVLQHNKNHSILRSTGQNAVQRGLHLSEDLELAGLRFCRFSTEVSARMKPSLGRESSVNSHHVGSSGGHRKSLPLGFAAAPPIVAYLRRQSQ